MSLLKNISIIPVPEWAYISSRGDVFKKVKDQHGIWKTVSLGKLSTSLGPNNEKMMIPNQNMLKYHNDIMTDYFGEDAFSTHDYIAGSYAVSLRISSQIGLYQTVQRTLGVNTGNALMDYALMCNVLNTNAVYHIDSFTKSHLHYSLKSLNKTSLSKELKNITLNNFDKFRSAWLKRYQENFTCDEVWLIIDGSNHDCKTVGSAIAKKGHKKSVNSCNVIGQIWAISTDIGIPIHYSVNNADTKDSDALKNVIKTLEVANIKVRGVLLDRGLASDEILNLIKSLNYQYVITLKNDCDGFETMLKQHAEDIRYKVNTLVFRDGIYGIIKQVKVFNNEDATNVGLFFNSYNATENSDNYSNKVISEIDRVKEEISLGNYDVTVAKDLANIISIIKSDNSSKLVVDVNHIKWQEIVDSKGFFALACSDGIAIEELYNIYCLINSFEQVFANLKSQLGFDTLRDHFDSITLSRVTVAFIAAIERQILISNCKNIDVPFNIMMQKLEKMLLKDDGNGLLIPTLHIEEKVKLLFEVIGVNPSDFNDLAIQVAYINSKKNISACRTMFSLQKDNIKTLADEIYYEAQARKLAAQKDNSLKRRVGRPKGSKNKKSN